MEMKYQKITVYADAEDIITKIQDDFHKKWSAGDAKGLADFYHPDAVLIKKGSWVAYGIKGIIPKNLNA